MAADDKYSVVVVQVMGTTALANCFFVNVIDDSGYADKYDGVAEQFEDEIVDSLKLIQCTSVEYECLLIRQLQPQTAPARVYDLTQVGTNGTDALPSNQVMSVEHVSSDRRPPFRGRWFISGVSESFVSEGRWRSGDIAAINTFLGKTDVQYGAATKYYQLQHYSDAQEAFYDIKRSYVSPIPRKLRGRTPGLCSIS